MHLAGTLSLYQKMKKASFQHPKGDLRSDSYFLNVAGDQKRFQKLLEGECAKDPYSIDAARRLYWGVENQLSKTKDYSKKSSEKMKKDVTSFLENLRAGDYQNLKKDPFAKKVLKEAGNSNNFSFQNYDSGQHITDKFSAYLMGNKEYGDVLIKENPGMSEEDLKAYASSVLTARSMITGRPVFSEFRGQTPDLVHFEEGVVHGKKLPVGSLAYKKELNKLNKKYNKTGKSIRRYPNAPSPAGPQYISTVDGFGGQRNMVKYTTTLTPPPTSVFNCLDNSEALAEYINKNSQDQEVLVDYLKEGQTLTMNKDLIEDVNFTNTARPKASYADKRRESSKGWICSACGSGIHVHDDGGVHFVTRDRKQDLYKQSSAALKSIDKAQNTDLTLGSLLHLPSYIINDCEKDGDKCGCLKNINGNKLKTILKSNKTTKVNMITKSAEGYKLNNDKTQVKNSKACVFNPPVPHSCTYRPKGESKSENELKEIKGKLYCKLRDELKKFPDNPASEFASTERCEELGSFPRPESDCYPILKTPGVKEEIFSSDSNTVQE
jgi:hypothetical protein